MRSYLVLALATFAATCEAALLRGNAESLEVSSDWAALEEAESEDRNFLFAQIDQTESELLELQQSLGQTTGAIAQLQISATPVDKKASVAAKPAAKAPESKKEVTPVVAKKAAPATVADPAKMLDSIKMPSLGKLFKGTAALAPMLAMLKGLYQDSKDRISQQNAREEKSKKWFSEKEGEHKAKMASIEGKFQNHTLSEEFRTNETRDENRYFNYWERCRQRQHRQFHTNLKIQHAMMMKTKKMVDMYEKAISPKAADQQQAKKSLGAMTGMPEIVFLQNMHRNVAAFCHDALAQVRKERAELQELAKEGNAW